MNRKIKITFILPDLKTGGAEMVMMRLMNSIDRTLYQPSFIAIRETGNLKDYIRDDVDYLNLKKSRLFLSLTALHKALRKNKPDIVVSTMAHTNFITLILEPFFPKTRFIVRESTLPACTLNARGLQTPLIRVAYKILYRRADLIIAPAGIILTQMQSELGLSGKKMRTLYNPVDASEIRKNLLHTPSTKRKFIAVGRLHFEKGFDRLIGSLSIWKNHDDWQLDILGEGGKREKWQALVHQHGLEDKIKLTGFHKNPWQHMADADAFLLPSRWEGSPNAALEALACGTPVIALRDAGGIIETAMAAQAGTVTITENMSEFLQAMDQVKPKTTLQPSLLPPIYDHQASVRSFENLLQTALQTP